MLLNVFSSPLANNNASSQPVKPSEPSNTHSKPYKSDRLHKNTKYSSDNNRQKPNRSNLPQLSNSKSVSFNQAPAVKDYGRPPSTTSTVKDYGRPVKDYGVKDYGMKTNNVKDYGSPSPTTNTDSSKDYLPSSSYSNTSYSKNEPSSQYRDRDRNYRNNDDNYQHGGNDRYNNHNDYSRGNNHRDHRQPNHHHASQNRFHPSKDAPVRGAINPRLSAKEHAMLQQESLPQVNMPKAEMLTEEQKKSQQRAGENASMISKTAFEKLGLSQTLSEHLVSINFTKPTLIQAQSVPPLIAGRDALIQAETGSGKTLSYLLPVLHDLSSHSTRLVRDDGTHAIILAPTRELALQIQDVWKEIAKPFYWLVSTTIMGGEKKKSEKARLRKGVHVCIGTPGRIVDHLDTTQSWILGSIRWFILDEADRLFDLGFRESIKTIHLELMKRCDEKPRCVLVSATLSKRHLLENVFELSNMLLTDPVHIGFEGVEDVVEKKNALKKKQSKNRGDGDDDDEDNDDGDEDDEDSDSDVAKSFIPATMDDDDYYLPDDDDDDEADEIRNQLLGTTLSQQNKLRNIASAAQEVSEGMARDLSAAPLRDIKDSDSSDSDDDNEHGDHDDDAQPAIQAKFSTPKTLEQLYVKMSSRHRLVALASFLRLRIFNAQQQGNKCKMIVFAGTCASVEFLHKLFSHAYWPDDSVTLTGKSIDSTVVDYSDRVKSGDASINVTQAYEMKSQQNKELKQALLETQLWKLHGNMPQKLRTETFKRFCEATEGILFSTDVSARGLDLPFVDWIVQYDAPEDTEDYIHRVGRTARIGHSGRAILFLLESEEGYLRVLKNQGAELKPIPLATLLTGLHVGLPSKSPLLQTQRPLGAILQKQFEKLTGISHHLNTLAKASYIAFIRAYAAYPKNLKSIFHPRRLHLGEVAHSFACTETPSEITKYTKDILKLAQSTINPEKAAREEAEEEEAKRKEKKAASLQSIARNSAKRQDLAEFI